MRFLRESLALHLQRTVLKASILDTQSQNKYNLLLPAPSIEVDTSPGGPDSLLPTATQAIKPSATTTNTTPLLKLQPPILQPSPISNPIPKQTSAASQADPASPDAFFSPPLPQQFLQQHSI